MATGCLSDLEHAILNIGRAVALMDNGYQDKLPDLLNLSSNQITLFGQLGTQSENATDTHR